MANEYAKWFGHFLNVTKLEMNLELTLAENVAWENVPAVVREEIESQPTELGSQLDCLHAARFRGQLL